jgi:large subunit ribosomal protein L5
MYYPRLKKLYYENIVNKLKHVLGVKSIMSVPKMVKIVLSKGIGKAILDKKLITYGIEELSLITGQKAVPCFSKKDEAGFKLRKNIAIGCKVTLRSNIMYEFFDRVVTVALPRVRDFRGLDINSFDGRGNYNLGLKEQIIFPEIDIDKINQVSGLNINFVTSTNSDNQAKHLLQLLGLPFKK